ncbi:MAG: hypothetical protein HKN87_14795 [Saprospiraceae bacterium]|nr:hypothetical protein [Saprospiraceae bacterium]
MIKYDGRRSFIAKTATMTAGLAVSVSALNAGCAAGNVGNSGNIKLKRYGRSISISLSLSDTVNLVDIRLFSGANRYIFEYDDVSPHAPKVENEQTKDVWMPGYDEMAAARRQSSREQRFPVVDVVLKEGMEAVIEFDLKQSGEYSFNDQGMKVIAEEIRIPKEQIEYWGNSLILDPKTNSIESFYLSSGVIVVDSMVNFEFDTLRDDWVGLISVHNADTKELIASTDVLWDAKLSEVSTGTGLSRQRMIRSLSWATRFVLDCQNTNPKSDTYGGEFLIYDMSAKTRLRSAWCWAWGPSAKMLLESSAIKGVDAGISSTALRQRAVDIGHNTLRRQIIDPTHPAYGAIRTSAGEASTVDSLFLVGWGWMPLYRATGDRRYIEAGEKVAETINRLMDEHEDVWIPQAYVFEREDWKEIMSFESSMGLPGLAGLYMETGDNYYLDTTIRLADLLIRAFEKENGLWGVFFKGKTKKSSSVNYWTKAFGYIIDGLIEAHKVAPDKGYLKKVIRITEQVLATQAPDGSFAVRFDRSVEFVGVGEKATALWSGLLIRLYKLTGNKTYFTAGMKSLEWCMDHQYFGEDVSARGGIVGRSWPSGITFRHWFDVIVTYTVSFFGNSLLEALSLDEWKE